MKLFVFSASAFVVVLFASFLVPPLKLTKVTSEVLGSNEETNYRVVPILSITSSYPTFSANSVYAFDVDSGISLYEKNPNERVLPASTTKIITSLVVLDHYALDEILTVNITDVDGQKMGLVNGEQIRVVDLLYGLLVWSANDAAEVFAVSYPGGKEEFVNAMNQKSALIGMTDSHFQNPQGYENENHYSSAEDLALAASYALKDVTFAKIVSTKEYTAFSVNEFYKHKMVNLNELLGRVDGVLGVKTGWTENAKENLVTYSKRDGKNVITVVLGSDDRFEESERLIEWIYDSYAWRSVTDSYLNNQIPETNGTILL